MKALVDQVIPQEISGLKGSVNPSNFTPSFQQELLSLSQITAWKGLCAILVDWVVVVACMAAAIHFPHPLVWIVAGILIATRQHALLIIMHDASHWRLLPNRKWNDRVSNWFLAWPVLVSTEGYRNNHLAHHVHLNTDRDPDWVRKEGKSAWEFPKTKWQLFRLLCRDFLGGGFLDQIRAITDLSGNKLRESNARSSKAERILYYLVLAGGIWAAGLGWQVLCLWFLPAFMVLPVILRIRSIAEHFGVENENELNSSRNMHPSWWERFLVAPHQVGFHLDHHLYSAVPFYNLPKLHKLLLTRPDYAHLSHQSHSLFGPDQTSVVNEVTIECR